MIAQSFAELGAILKKWITERRDLTLLADGGTIRQDKLQAFGVCRAIFGWDGKVIGQKRCMFGLAKLWEGTDKNVGEACQFLIENILFCYNYVLCGDDTALETYNPDDLILNEESVVNNPEVEADVESEEEAAAAAVGAVRTPPLAPAAPHNALMSH